MPTTLTAPPSITGHIMHERLVNKGVRVTVATLVGVYAQEAASEYLVTVYTADGYTVAGTEFGQVTLVEHAIWLKDAQTGEEHLFDLSRVDSINICKIA